MTAREDAQRAEAEARRHVVDGMRHPDRWNEEGRQYSLDTYAKAVRRTEALKASEMLSILDIIEHHDYLMEHEFSSGLRARIRRVLKEAHGA